MYFIFTWTSFFPYKFWIKYIVRISTRDFHNVVWVSKKKKEKIMPLDESVFFYWIIKYVMFLNKYW